MQARTKARERAAEKAAVFAARESKLRELAEQFFLVEVDVEDARAAAADRVEKVAQRAVVETAAINAEADQKVADLEAGKVGAVDAMLNTGASVSEVAERLGLSAAAVRRLRTSATSNAAPVSAAGADGSKDAAVLAASEDTSAGELDAEPSAESTATPTAAPDAAQHVG